MRVILNLLSPEKKIILRKARALDHAERLLFAACFVAAFCAATLVGVRMMLVSTRDTLAESSSGEAAETSTFAERARQINTYLKRVGDIEDSTTPWSTIVTEVTRAASSGVSYTSVSVDRTGVRISGVARTRKDVLDLKTKLESSPTFTDVRAPLSNILQPTDVKFDFEMKIAAIAKADAEAAAASKSKTKR